MSELGDFLELLHEAHTRLSTFRAEYRDWSRPRPNLELVRSEVEVRRLHWRGAGPFPRATLATRRIWFEQPASLRVEIQVDDKLIRFGVLNRTQWWRWDTNQGTDTGEARSETDGGWWIPPLLSPSLIDPVRLLVNLRLQPTGRSVRAGRDVVCVGGRPRRAGPSDRALSYEFEFDAEHGTMLRRAVFDNGHLVAATEAMEVAYDGDLTRGLFVFTAPDGEPARGTQPGAPSHDGDASLHADDSTADEGGAPAAAPIPRS